MKNKAMNRYLKKDFLYDELLCGFVSFSPDGQILSINKTMASWVGIDFQEVQVLNFKSLMTKSSMLYYNMVVDPLLNLKSVVSEISLKFSGSEGSFDALLNAESYKNEQGKLILINATVQKITDRKRYENEILREKRHAEEEKRKYEFLFNSAPNQIWTTDAEGKILTVNERVKDYFGITEVTDVYGLSGIFREDRQKYQTLWRYSLANGTAFQGEIRLQGIANIPEWFMITAEPYSDKDGKIEMWFFSSTNINKQKMLQIASQTEQKISLSNAYKTLADNQERFVSIAMNQSHMIRKPLANILGLVQLLSDEDASPEFKNLLNMLLVSVEELDTMIKQANKTNIPDLNA
ncbi:MAG: PAS domain S-box protein [Pedobacter sp.]|uniref:PAS domain S-box protein n=1 Tax=Pedobacter sp. TaxID=1411316 RepID=UPI0033977E3C